MSYFDDQYDAWLDSDCDGDPTDINPDEYWADKIDACEHIYVSVKTISKDDEGTKTYRSPVCDDCGLIDSTLEISKGRKLSAKKKK